MALYDPPFIRATGRDFEGRPVLLVDGTVLDDNKDIKEVAIIEYVISRLNVLGVEHYVVVFIPPQTFETQTKWLEYGYDLMTPQFKENIMGFYLLYPTPFVSLGIQALLSTEVTDSFWDSFRCFKSMIPMFEHVPIDSVDFRPQIFRLEREEGRHLEAGDSEIIVQKDELHNLYKKLLIAMEDKEENRRDIEKVSNALNRKGDVSLGEEVRHVAERYQTRKDFRDMIEDEMQTSLMSTIENITLDGNDAISLMSFKAEIVSETDAMVKEVESLMKDHRKKKSADVPKLQMPRKKSKPEAIKHKPKVVQAIKQETEKSALLHAAAPIGDEVNGEENVEITPPDPSDLVVLSADMTPEESAAVIQKWYRKKKTGSGQKAPDIMVLPEGMSEEEGALAIQNWWKRKHAITQAKEERRQRKELKEREKSAATIQSFWRKAQDREKKRIEEPDEVPAQGAKLDFNQFMLDIGAENSESILKEDNNISGGDDLEAHQDDGGALILPGGMDPEQSASAIQKWWRQKHAREAREEASALMFVEGPSSPPATTTKLDFDSFFSGLGDAPLSADEGGEADLMLDHSMSSEESAMAIQGWWRKKRRKEEARRAQAAAASSSLASAAQPMVLLPPLLVGDAEPTTETVSLLPEMQIAGATSESSLEAQRLQRLDLQRMKQDEIERRKNDEKERAAVLASAAAAIAASFGQEEVTESEDDIDDALVISDSMSLEEGAQVIQKWWRKNMTPKKKAVTPSPEPMKESNLKAKPKPAVPSKSFFDLVVHRLNSKEPLPKPPRRNASLMEKRQHRFEQWIETMKNGQLMNHHSRTGDKCWQCHMQLSTDGDHLLWSLPRQKNLNKKILLQDIQGITYGHKSQGLRTYKIRLEWLCFTLWIEEVAQGGKGETAVPYDFSSRNEASVTMWMIGLLSLLRGHMMTEGKILWRRAQMKLNYYAQTHHAKVSETLIKMIKYVRGTCSGCGNQVLYEPRTESDSLVSCNVCPTKTSYPPLDEYHKKVREELIRNIMPYIRTEDEEPPIAKAIKKRANDPVNKIGFIAKQLWGSQLTRRFDDDDGDTSVVALDVPLLPKNHLRVIGAVIDDHMSITYHTKFTFMNLKGKSYSMVMRKEVSK